MQAIGPSPPPFLPLPPRHWNPIDKTFSTASFLNEPDFARNQSPPLPRSIVRSAPTRKFIIVGECRYRHAAVACTRIYIPVTTSSSSSSSLPLVRDFPRARGENL